MNRCRLKVALRLFGVLFLLRGKVSADSISLRGGERLIGQILSEGAQTIVFESQTLGRLEFPKDRVEMIENNARPTDTKSSNPNSVLSDTNPTTQNSPIPPTTSTSEFRPWNEAFETTDAFDWIQLKSGEWLKGRVKSLQEDKLEFDSDKLNQLEFHWKDVRMVRSPRPNSVRMEGRPPVIGSVMVTTNEVEIISSDSTNRFPRQQLLAIAPAGDRELDKWTAKLSTGVSFRAGNTREADADVHLTLQRRTPGTRFGLDYLGNYTKINGRQSEDNHRLIGEFDYFLSRRLYLRVPDVEYFRDPLQNLSHRLTVGSGVGYDLISTPRTEWSVTAGPAWQDNWFKSVETGETSNASSMAMVLSTRFDIELTARIDYIFEYRCQITSAEDGNNTHHAISTLEFDIHKRLKLDLSLVWDRIANPKAESSGITPTPDDFRLITSLTVEY